jgi:hypothetical protein
MIGHWSSNSKFRIQQDSATTLAAPQYSTLALERDKVDCHFADQETKLSPR